MDPLGNMTIRKDRVIVSTRVFRISFREEFPFDRCGGRRNALAQAYHWLLVRWEMRGKQSASGHRYIREAVSRSRQGRYLFLQYFRDGKLIRAISVGRITGHRYIRDAVSGQGRRCRLHHQHLRNGRTTGQITGRIA